MKALIVAVILMCSSLCQAAVLTMVVPDSLKRCRQDFAVKLCKSRPDLYKCVMFRKGKQLYLTWEEIFGNGSVKIEMQKINRRNSLVWRNHCIAQTDDLYAISPFPRSDGKYQEKTIVVDLRQLAWGAYQNGKLVKWGIASGGAGKCKETGKYACYTPAGNWKVYEIKKGFARSSLYPVECKDKKKCGYPFFGLVKWGPHFESFHGELEGHIPGSNISHGCVRMPKAEVAWMIKNFVEIGTAVVVLPY